MAATVINKIVRNMDLEYAASKVFHLLAQRSYEFDEQCKY